jgi:MYXO-CTERM domain-containing protein
MVLFFWMTVQQPLPESCVLTGLCGVVRLAPPVPPGVLFVAVGLVAAGVLVARRRREVK